MCFHVIIFLDVCMGGRTYVQIFFTAAAGDQDRMSCHSALARIHRKFRFFFLKGEIPSLLYSSLTPAHMRYTNCATVLEVTDMGPGMILSP